MYAKEFNTKEKQKLTEIKNEQQHIFCDSSGSAKVEPLKSHRVSKVLQL